MNLPNQDLIVTLRELGYDIKSHSSTVDSNAVGLLIAALGKKKEKEKEKPKTTKTATVSKTTSKASSTASVVTPTPVKPRVLSRYRPTPAGQIPVPGELPQDVAATQSQAPVETKSISPIINAPQLPPEIKTDEVKTKDDVVPESVIDTTPPVVEPISESIVVEEIEVQTIEITEETIEKSEEEDLDSGINIGGISQPGQAIKPMAPSVPIRIAAPSFRATPPRPPKSHRSQTQERHAPKKEEKSRPTATTVEAPKVVVLTGALTVQELAEKLSTSDTEVIKRLFIKGYMRTVNQLVELELARDLATELGLEIASEADIAAQKQAELDLEAFNKLEELTDEDKAALVSRPPVVTIMGHVDHGKTSLLDAIRQTKFLLTDAEAGGITQHIGAYHVEVPGEDGALRQIVFLDTPGHEAFTAMRARGAKATDVAVLVVAADDGVMPQTIEAIDHAKAAGVPMVVAVNKIDKADADPDHVLSQLMEHNLIPDKYGGDTVTVAVSAKKRTGLDELLEMILLVADLLDLKANPEKLASGTIIEAELSRGKGAVATALVQNGTLREGDFLVAGSASGRVRALFDDRGQRVKAAGPSMPVEVLGLTEVPQAGDKFEVVTDIQAAKALGEQRKAQENDRRGHRVTLESLHDLVEQGEVKELNIIVKADVQGTAEAIADQVKRLSNREVQVAVLRTASGDISENDVNLATSSNAIIIGFNVQPDANATRAGETAGVDIRTYSIIYQIVDDLQLAIEGLLQPVKQEVEIGQAEVRQLFKVGKNLMIAGCYVLGGKIQRNAFVRIERDSKQIYEGKIETLKRFKDDAREVAQGFECGMSFEKFSDLKEGDQIRAFIIQEVKRNSIR
jgi:translation initiation factor IF-2